MKNKTIIILIIVVLLIGASFTAILYFKPFDKSDKQVQETIDTIEKFQYELEKRDTELFKSEYDKLKSILSKEEINYKEYAEAIAKLYIIDLYTLNNKKNVYDCGSTEYVYPAIKENFELKVKDTLYKYIENDTGSREQKLPTVKSVEITNSKEDSVIFDDKTFPSYIVNISWDYIEDLGYDKQAELVLIKDEEKIYVLEQK